MGNTGHNAGVSRWGTSFSSLRRTRRMRRLKALAKGHNNVYFVQSGDGMVKIGYARSPMTRLANLRASNALRVEMLVYAPGDSVAEERLHSAFAEHRRNGEWFSPAPALLAYIEELKAAVDWWEPSAPQPPSAP